MIPTLATHLPRLTAPLLPDVLWRVPTQDRRLYLTFDDGPTPGVTQQVAEVLVRYGARASFFLIGGACRRLPEIVRAVAEAGHALGNHSYTHLDPWRSSRGKLLDEMQETTAAIEDVTGTRVGFCRPPYGHLTPALRAWCRTHRQALTMWDVMPGDFLPGTSPARLERFMIQHVRPGSIVVLHDNLRTGDILVPALKSVLRALAEDGWSFDALPASGTARESVQT